MDFVKGAADGHVDKIIDQAADVVKVKVGGLIGGKDPNKGGAKDPKTEGVGDKLSNKAADQAMAFGKNLLG